MNRDDPSPVSAYLRSPTLVDFPGHLAAVFLTNSCNFQCGFCHNATFLQGLGARRLTWGKLADACEQFRSDWVDAAVISGGEPTLLPELPRLVRFFRDLGWAVKLDTNGSRPDVLEACLPSVDYTAMDIKAGFSGYPKLTGFSDCGKISESLALLKRQAQDYELRTTVIDSFHTDDQMLEIAGQIKGAKRYIIQPFVPRDELPDPRYRRQSRTSPERLDAVRRLVGDAADEVIVRGE